VRKLVTRVVLAAMVGIVAHTPMSGSSPMSLKPGTLRQVKALVGASVNIHRLSYPLQVALEHAQRDNAGIAYNIPSNCETPTACVYGDTSATQSVVLYGDSHAEMWLPALDRILSTDQLKLIFIGQRGCPVVLISTPNHLTACASPRLTDLNVIDAIQPLAIILADRTSYRFGHAEWQAGMTSTLDALAQSNAKIAIMGDIQVFNMSVPLCLATNPTAVQNCSVANPNTQLPGQQSAEQAAARKAGATYINPTPWLCTTTRCSPVIGPDIPYWNASLLSVTYVKYLTKVVGAALKSTI